MVCILVELNKKIYTTPLREIKLKVLMLVMTQSELPEIFLLHVVLLSTVRNVHLDVTVVSVLLSSSWLELM